MDQRTTRRGFLTQSGCAFVGLCGLGLGLSREELAALPVRLVSGEGEADERRYPVPGADSVNVDHAAQVIVVRSQDRAYAFALACPHEQGSLKWVLNDHRFQCTKHDSRYQPDGVHVSGRATRNMDRFPIQRDGAVLVVSTNGVFRSDLDPAGWAAASVSCR